jgi:hypothetical protein
MLNPRRDVLMVGDGKSPQRPNEFLEARAVLNCLANLQAWRWASDT